MELKGWMPSKYFLDLLSNEFYYQGNPQASEQFETFQIQMDSFYRIFYQNDNDLFPKETNNKLTLINYQRMFEQSQNTDDKDFYLQPNYSIEYTFASNRLYRKSCFPYFTTSEWELFFSGKAIFLNCRDGIGADSFIFDYPCYFTGFQDKYRLPDQDKKLEEKEILDAYNNVTTIFNEMKNNDLALNAWIKINLENKLIFFQDKENIGEQSNKDFLTDYFHNKINMRLIFRALRTQKNFNLDNLKTTKKTNETRSIILIGLEAFEERNKGLLDLRLQFYSKQKRIKEFS